MVGKSTCGSAETGSDIEPSIPPSMTAIPSSEVAIGRWMKGDETLMGWRPGAGPRSDYASLSRLRARLRVGHGFQPGERAGEKAKRSPSAGRPPAANP